MGRGREGSEEMEGRGGGGVGGGGGRTGAGRGWWWSQPFVFESDGDERDVRSLPTRRSCDLGLCWIWKSQAVRRAG